MATSSSSSTFAEQHSTRGMLCAVLLNPSLSTGSTISHSNLEVAATTLGFSGFQIANLIQLASRNSKDLAPMAINEDDWLKSRPEIERALNSSDEVVFAWGVSRLAGEANSYKEEQINWTIQEALSAGHFQALLMGGSPRHPSRWRQYVGPQRNRIPGDTLEDRFQLALNRHPIKMLQKLGGNQQCEVPWVTEETSSITEEMYMAERVRRTI